VPICIGANEKGTCQTEIECQILPRARAQLETSAGERASAHSAGRQLRRIARTDDALRELNLAVTLHANEASILYNAACVYRRLKVQN